MTATVGLSVGFIFKNFSIKSFKSFEKELGSFVESFRTVTSISRANFSLLCSISYSYAPIQYSVNRSLPASDIIKHQK